jgi:hypothetical protein
VLLTTPRGKTPSYLLTDKQIERLFLRHALGRLNGANSNDLLRADEFTFL